MFRPFSPTISEKQHLVKSLYVSLSKKTLDIEHTWQSKKQPPLIPIAPIWIEDTEKQR